MTHYSYITHYLFPSWVRSWNFNFKIWADLMTNNYEVYANPWGESPERECYEWFWASINTNDTYPKEFLEGLYQMIDKTDTRILKTVPAKDVFNRLNELLSDMQN